MVPKVWKKKSQQEIEERVFEALEKNIQYEDSPVLGVPASYLDPKVFYQDATILKGAPYISTLVQNPNHIGCHTLGESEPFFQGTQDIERELIDICTIDILGGEEGQQDGYVASGGTEANMQAIWIYRNFFKQELGAQQNEICILCSSDSHYSMDKAADILNLDIYKALVMEDNRSITLDAVDEALGLARNGGKKFFIVVCNMMTTMFGSVDDISVYVDVLKKAGVEYKIHVDGAYGGFYFPFTTESDALTFKNPEITSFTLDAHKMAQAPYGTGIFLVRKGYMPYASTKGATYVKGTDYTVIGSRSGANAVGTWMILVKNGPYGWMEKNLILQNRTNWMCQELDELKLDYYRHPKSNIVTLKAEGVSESVASHFGLVPDDHDQQKWYKLVIMEHVTIEKLKGLVDALRLEQKTLTPMA
jgi:glutamate/tyrosine decarboxylase-like PLP-dependent enzyme